LTLEGQSRKIQFLRKGNGCASSRESGLERAEVGSAVAVQHYSLPGDDAVRKTGRIPGNVAEAI